METFNIQKTERTPEIIGSIQESKLSIKGRSYPEDAKSFYSPFITWFKEFLEHAPNSIVIEIDLDYVNTSTTIFLTNIIIEIKNIASQKHVNVQWIYDADDLDMAMIGSDYKRILGDLLELKERKTEENLIL